MVLKGLQGISEVNHSQPSITEEKTTTPGSFPSSNICKSKREQCTSTTPRLPSTCSLATKEGRQAGTTPLEWVTHPHCCGQPNLSHCYTVWGPSPCSPEGSCFLPYFCHFAGFNAWLGKQNIWGLKWLS